MNATRELTNLKGEHLSRTGTMRKYCAVCGRFLGFVPAFGMRGTSRGLCLRCLNLLRENSQHGNN